MVEKRVKRPVIGVTGPGKRGRANWWFFKVLIRLLGGRPVHITPRKKRAVKDIDGLILSGGADINPERYGREKASLPYKREKKRLKLFRLLIFPFTQLCKEVMAIGSSAVNEERDELEFNLLKEALAKPIPVMGICRGMQLINVSLGGSLYHDLKSLPYVNHHKRSVRPTKTIYIESGSLVAKLMEATTCKINSLHNQGVDGLGEGLRITAKDEDGLVQAVESQTYSCCFGVQWHPEYMPFNPRQRILLRHFIRTAKG